MRISDWSSDVCSSDLSQRGHQQGSNARCGKVFKTDQQTAFEHCAQNECRIFGHADIDGIHTAATDNLTHAIQKVRSEERRVGKEWFSTCRSRWSPEH